MADRRDIRALDSEAVTASPDAPTVGHLVGKRFPDFFVVGPMKSGTTALYTMLKRHPQIYLPASKEPWFFASELQLRDPPRPTGTGWTPKTVEHYLSLFEDATPEQRVGEASALYLWSPSAAERIATVQPAARIIAVLREPASFLRSLHLQFVQVYLETEVDLRKALALEESRRQGRNLPSNEYWPGATFYSDHARYVEQLRRYHAVFPPEQVLVLIYDDFRRDNEATLRQVLRFLEVDDTVAIGVRDANPTVRVRAPRLHAMVHSVSAGQAPLPRAVRASLKALAPRKLNRQTAVAIRDRLFFTGPRPPDEQLMLELRRRFKGEVVALSEYLDRDLVTLWGYDDID